MDAVATRRIGILPKIDIVGEAFVIDLRLQELRHARDFTPIISLRSFTMSDDGNFYQAFYQPLLKQTVEIDTKLTEFPDRVIMIRIPNELGLDPIGTAQKYGMDEDEILSNYPVKENLKAEIIPLSETGIPQLIAQNRKALQAEHTEIKKAHKLRRRPRL